MADESRLVDALLIAGSIALFFGGAFYVAYRVVTWARRQSKKAYVIGAALAPFMAFNVVDPDFRIVNEAKQLKKREEDNPGDPPDGEGESMAPQEVQETGELEHGESEAEVAMTTKSRVWHPAFARAIAIVLSLMALATSVVASMVLLSDLYGSDARQSFSAFEWASIYLMSALLLVSMFQLFRLRKISVWLFAGYVGLGILLAIGQSLLQDPSRYLDLRVMFVTVAVALAVLGYMRRLSTRGALV
jgi:hypothetical protein